MAEWRDGFWTSPDGLRLHYRDYPGDPARVPVLCLPGLTRNARDFEPMVERLAGTRRIIVAELRGRGGSAWAPDFESYAVPTYVADVLALLDALGLEQVVMFGTSLGGIIAMVIGAGGDRRLAGVLLNDVGPIVEEEGLERIRGYIGREARWAHWDEAARAMRDAHGHAFPSYDDADWLAMARRLAHEQDGAIVPEFDPRIAILFCMPTVPPAEPWRLIEGFRDMPALLVRGTLSDIITAETAAEMARRLPLLEVVEVVNVGHPPLLDEPEAVPAIDRLLARVDGGA